MKTIVCALLLASAQVLLVKQDLLGAEEASHDTSAIAFTMANGGVPSVNRRSAVVIIAGKAQPWQSGTDFTSPVMVPQNMTGAADMLLIPYTGFSIDGVTGQYKVDLTPGGTTSVAIRSTPPIPVRVNLLTADGVPMGKCSVTVCDVTYRDRGYVNENYVADSSENGEFSFYGYTGETYELKTVKSDLPQRPEIIFPDLVVGHQAIVKRLTAPDFPKVTLNFVQSQSGKDTAISGDKILTYKQDNSRSSQRIPLHDGHIEFLIFHDFLRIDEAKSLECSLDGFTLDPSTISLRENTGKIVTIHCLTNANAKPDVPAIAKVPIAITVTDRDGEAVKGGSVVILKRDVNASGDAEFNYLRSLPGEGKFICQSDPKPFVGYILYDVKVGHADAIFSQKELVTPGSTYTVKVLDAPHKLTVGIVNFPATPGQRRSFTLVDAHTYQPVSGAVLYKDSPGVINLAAFPGKYRLLFMQNKTSIQLLGDIEVKKDDPEEVSVALDWLSLMSLDMKELEKAQKEDFDKK